VRRIITDKAKKISVDPLYPRDPRSIIPYTDNGSGMAYLDALRPGMFQVLNQAACRRGSVSGLSAGRL